MAQVFGVGIDELQKTLANNRYFYGLRRTDAGELYMVKSDLLRLEDGVQLNRPGNIDENSIFYLMSRGLSHAQSKKLLTNGFLNEVIEKISNKNIKSLIKKLTGIQE